MKKSIFILAALMVATFSNAQITLEHTFTGSLDGGPMIDQNVWGDFYVVRNKTTKEINIYDANTYDVVCTLSVPNMTRAALFSKNIFTTDGKFACFVQVKDESKSDNTRSHFYIYDENNSIVADLGTSWDAEWVNLVKLSTGYKLLVEKVAPDYNFTTEIYSLPGNGEPQAISAPSSPKRSSSTRKIARDGQVLVETDNTIYTLTGQEVK